MRKLAFLYYLTLAVLISIGIVLHLFRFPFEEVVDVEMLVWLIILTAMMFAVCAAVKGRE